MIFSTISVISKLCRGSMATLYLALDLRFDANVATNVLNKNLLYIENIRKRFIAEAKFMSPKEIKSFKDVGLQKDIYSLGIVLWQMVTGKKPYDTSAISSFDMQQKIVQEDLPPTNTMWDACIKGATHKNNQFRFQSIAAFESELLGSSSEHTIID